MADTSDLEATLFAALGMPEPAPDKPAPTQGETPRPQSHERHPAQDPSSEPLPTPTHPAPATYFSPTPPASSALIEATTQVPLEVPAQVPAPAPAAAPALTPNSTSTPTPITAPITNALATTTSAPLPTPTSTLDTRPASDSSTKVSNPPPVHPLQSLAQALAPPRTDVAPQQPRPAAPAPAHQGAPGSRSPKRPRSSDDPDESSVKRQRVDQTASKQDNVAGAPSIDFAAMLNDALASFDRHAPPQDNDIIMQDADLAPPPAPASTTSDVEKAENKIMKASSNPFYVMRSMSLPVLGNIAVQILLRLSQQPRAETESLLADSGSEFRKAYDMLRDIFRPTRKAFSDSPLLSADELDITDSEDRETIRMSNLAATAASVFGAHDVAAHDVHDAFFSIFIPEDGEYKSYLTPLLVSLKTRLLLDALNKPDQSQPVSQLLDMLFPVHFDESLKQRSGDLLLHADEEDLVAKIRERREQLVKSAADESIKKSLEDQSSSTKFTESLSIFLQSHLGVVVDYAEKYGVNIPLNEDETATAREPNSAQQDEHDALVALLQSQLHQTDGDLGPGKDVLSNGNIPEQLGSAEDDGLDLRKLLEESLSNHIPELKELSADTHPSAGLPDFDSSNLASFISEKLKNELEIPTHGLPNLSAAAPVHPQFLAQMNQAHPQPYQPYTQGSTPTTPVGANGDSLPPNQSMPTAALYEKARQAAVAKSSNTTRREGLHSTRRPWTPEEEKALMAGLDMVKGPHWSQILSLFGPQGSISDILKDRTQVQLKDKARNLKLFFLKTNSEMPYYLQSVTGELKTRAPGQAARKEAEEKARMNLEEEQARIQGIMTLAGGLQNNHHPVSSAPHAASPPKRTSPATPGFGGPGASATPAAAHMATGNGAAVPIPPRIKTELPDQHPLHKVTAFPPIQPAPAPGAAMQPARTPLPPLQPQPGLHQQPRPHTQQPQQTQQPHQPQRPQHPHQQEAQMTPASMQQQQRQPLPQHQPQVQPQSQPSTHQQPQPQQHQPQKHQQTQPPPPTQARTQLQAASRPPSAPQPAPSQAPPQTQQPPRVSPPTTHTQPLPTPPIPPNHHSTPDHAQDTKLFETLQAAIAATTASETHTPIAAAVSEGSGTLN